MARAILLAEGVGDRKVDHIVRSFHAFAMELASGEEVRTVPAHMRRWLLQEAVRSSAQAHSLLERALQREGILTLLSAWVRELARERISPEALELLAQHGSDSERLTALAQVWRRYRDLLGREGWHEEEDIYAVAARACRERRSDLRLPSTVYLDGFSRFSRSEVELLRALAEARCEVVVTLCWEAGRDVLFESTSATLEMLREHFEVLHEHLSSGRVAHIAPAITHIAEHLFSASAQVLTANGTPEVEIWEAPHLLAETEMVAREIVRLHREGVAWGDMAVLCRDLASVLPNLQGVFEQFGVPTQSFEMHMLAEHPLVRALIGFMQIHDNDYPRDALISWLKNGYLPVDILEVDRLRRLAVRRAVRSGASGWLRLAEELEQEGSAVVPLLRAVIQHTQSLAQATSASQWLKTFQTGLSAMSFGMNCDTEANDVLTQAMEVAQQVAFLLDREGGGDPKHWAEAVIQAWAVTPQKRATAPRNAVWLLEASRSRPLQPRVAFVMGMQESRFPRRITEDAFLRDEDRLFLNQRTGCDLPLTTDASAMERLIFYQAATCARKRVVFTYSRTEGDHDVQPSFYLRSLRELFQQRSIVQRSVRLSDITAPLSQALDEQDIERTLVDSVFDRNPHTRRPMDDEERRLTAETLAMWLRDKPERCVRWWRWRTLPPLPQLSVGVRQANTRAYSATELEELQRCPFRHFVRWELKLRPDRVHYTAGQGRWLHAVLHRRHRQPEQPLEEALQEVVQQHPVDRPLGERHLLMQQVEELLRSVVKREETVYSAFGLQTRYTEATFGPALDENDEPAEGAFPALRLTLPDGERMHICGRIDRVDVFPENGMAVLLDYKRDLPDTWWQNIQAGEDFQTVLYVAALRQVWKLTPAAVALDSAMGEKRCRIVFLDSCPSELLQRLNPQPNEGYGVVQRVQIERWSSIERSTARKIGYLLNRLRRGDIIPTPGEHCQVCEYGGLCRVVMSAGGRPVHDGEPYPEASL